MHKKQHCKANKLLVKHIWQCDINYQVYLIATNYLNTLNVRPKRQKFIGYLILWWHVVSVQVKSLQIQLKSGNEVNFPNYKEISEKFNIDFQTVKIENLVSAIKDLFSDFLKAKQLLDLFSKTFLNKKHLNQFSLKSVACKAT